MIDIYMDFQMRFTKGMRTVAVEGLTSVQCGTTDGRGLNLLEVVTIAPDRIVTFDVKPRAALSGESILLKCLVSRWMGRTPEAFLWYRNKMLIAQTEEYGYTIRKAKKSDEASYRCELKIGYRKWISPEVDITITVPVAGAFLTSNTNKTEISAGFRLVLQCLVTDGTEPRFHWYLSNRQLENISESYHLNTDGSELIINSLQIGHGGRYHCVATNRGKDVGIFNTTSNQIDVTVLVQNHTTAITASVLPLLLIALLIALVFVKLRNKKQGNSSRISQPQGEASGNGAQPLSEETSAGNSEYAVVGSARISASDADQLNYCVLRGTKPREDDTKPAADLIYSVVTIKKSRDVDKDVGVSGWKQENKNDPNDYCITHATLNHVNSEASLEGEQMKEGDGCDANVYENLPRK